MPHGGSETGRGGAFQPLPALPCSGAQRKPLPCCLRLLVKEAWGRALGLPSVDPSGKQDSEMVCKEVL